MPKTVSVVVVALAAPNLLIGSKSGLGVGQSLRPRSHIRFADFTPPCHFCAYRHTTKTNTKTKMGANTKKRPTNIHKYAADDQVFASDMYEGKKISDELKV